MAEWALALAYLGAGLGAGLVTFGAGFGIGKIAAAAMDDHRRRHDRRRGLVWRSGLLPSGRHSVKISVLPGMPASSNTC